MALSAVKRQLLPSSFSQNRSLEVNVLCVWFQAAGELLKENVSTHHSPTNAQLSLGRVRKPCSHLPVEMLLRFESFMDGPSFSRPRLLS